MKKHILPVGALLAFSAAALAGPLNTKGIPTSAQGVFHIDLDAGAKSQVAQAIRLEAEKNVTSQPEAKKEYEDFKKQVGFDPAKDIADITVGLLPNLIDAEGPPLGVVIVRGKFSPEKILAYAKSKKAKTLAVGKHTFVSLDSLNATVPDADNTSSVVFSPIDKNTLVVVNSLDIKGAEAAIAAITGAAKSYTAPAALTTYGKQFSAPIVLGYVDGKFFPPSDPNAGPMSMPSPKSLYLALGDDSTSTKLRLTTDYAAAAEATQAQTFVQTMLGFVQMATANTNGPDGKPDPQKVADAAKLNKLLGALKFSTADKNLNLNVDYPTAEIVQFIKEQSAKKQ